MAKLYAELTSDKGGRTASKSSNGSLEIEVKLKNKVIAEMIILPSGNIYTNTYGEGEIVTEEDMDELNS